MYNAEGTRMVSFRSTTPGSDGPVNPENHIFCRGVCVGGGDGHNFFVGDSVGSVRAFQFDIDGESNNNSQQKTDPITDLLVFKDHSSSITEIAGGEKYVCSGDDGGKIVCYDAVGGR